MVSIKKEMLSSLSVGDVIYVDFDRENRKSSVVMKSISAMACKVGISVTQKTFITLPSQNNEKASGIFYEIIRVERTK